MTELAVNQMSLGGMDYTIESVVRSKQNGPLIAAAAALWIKDDDVVMDVTYGRGRFWTVYRPRTLITHDLADDGVDFRDLPESDGSVDVVVLDPPYITPSSDKSTLPDFHDRYGLTTRDERRITVPELLALYVGGFSESWRVLKTGGRLLVKCMDFVESGYNAFHPWLVREAEDIGYRTVDTFIHYSGVGATSPGMINKVQRTSRRAHSVLLVFRK